MTNNFDTLFKINFHGKLTWIFSFFHPTVLLQYNIQYGNRMILSILNYNYKTKLK